MRLLFKYDDNYTPLQLMHLAHTDRHREVYIMHYIYHHMKSDHSRLVRSVSNRHILRKVILLSIKYGQALIEKDFPELSGHSANESGRTQ